MQSIKIESFVLSEADDPFIDSWFRLQRESWLETNPGEQVFSRNELVQQWLAGGEGMDQPFFHVSDPSGKMLGTCSLSRPKSGERDRFAFVSVLVDPGFRRQGLAAGCSGTSPQQQRRNAAIPFPSEPKACAPLEG